MSTIEHALATIVNESQLHARPIGPGRGGRPNGKELPECGASLFDGDPDLTSGELSSSCALIGVRKPASLAVGLRGRRRMILKPNYSLPTHVHSNDFMMAFPFGR